MSPRWLGERRRRLESPGSKALLRRPPPSPGPSGIAGASGEDGLSGSLSSWPCPPILAQPRFPQCHPTPALGLSPFSVRC